MLNENQVFQLYEVTMHPETRGIGMNKSDRLNLTREGFCFIGKVKISHYAAAGFDYIFNATSNYSRMEPDISRAKQVKYSEISQIFLRTA